MSTFVIVDMQSAFCANDKFGKQVVDANCKLAQRFRRNGDGIVVVEYENCGPTLPAIQREVCGYTNHIYVEKSQDDGSQAVKFACKEFKFDASNFYIAGVNLGGCVRKTALGLCRLYPRSQIYICREAVDDPECIDSLTDVDRLVADLFPAKNLILTTVKEIIKPLNKAC